MGVSREKRTGQHVLENEVNPCYLQMIKSDTFHFISLHAFSYSVLILLAYGI
jgi:hypothetical protein